MKKPVLIAGAAVISAAVLITPKLVGSSVDDGLKSLVENINAQPGYTVSVKDFEQTWFDSTATISIQFDDPQIAGASDDDPISFNFDIDVNVDHGPRRFDIAQHLFGNMLQSSFSVAHGRRRVTVNRAEVALSVNQHIAHRPGLGHADHGIVNGSISVRVVFA